MLQYITDFNPEFDKRPLSYSSLKQFRKSPQHFIEYRLGAKVETEAMMLGTLIDELVLTPETFDGKFIVMPVDLKKPTSAQFGAAKPSEKSIEQMKKWNEWAAANKEKTWVCQEDWDLAHFLRDKIFKNGKANELMNRIVSTQKTLRWVDKKTGLPIISKLDADGDTFILDLKTANDGSPEGFKRSAYDLCYHIQAAIYREGMKVINHKYGDFWHLVLETKAPYNITCYKADEDFLKLGAGEFRDLMDEIKFCNDNNQWSKGYEFHSAVGYHSLELPGWARQKLSKYE